MGSRRCEEEARATTEGLSAAGPCSWAQAARSRAQQGDQEPGFGLVWNLQGAARYRLSLRWKQSWGERPMAAQRPKGVAPGGLERRGNKTVPAREQWAKWPGSNTLPGRRWPSQQLWADSGHGPKGASGLGPMPAKANSHTCGSKPKGQRAGRWEEGLARRCPITTWESVPPPEGSTCLTLESSQLQVPFP